jgi:hypothetical protein
LPTFHPLLLAIVLSLIAWVPARAEEESGGSRDTFSSIRGSVYSKRLANQEIRGYDARFRVQLSASVYRFSSFDEFIQEDEGRFKSLGIRPKLTWNLPTRWRHVSFIPALELQLTRRFDTNQNLLSGAVSGMFRYEGDRPGGHLVTYGYLKYGTRYDEDGLNVDDYVKIGLKAALNRSLGWTLGKHTMEITPFGSASYYLDELDIGLDDDLVTHIEREYELGLELGSSPRMYLWKLRIPELEISYVFGDDTRGIKIRF